MARPTLSDLDFGNVARIFGLSPGVQDGEPVTVAQMKAQIEGLAWKDNVRVSTQGNINLASPGTAIDGITLALSDRVLVRSQTAAAENGIYLWNGGSSAMTRAPDASTAEELESAITTVDEGTSAGATFRQTLVNFTLGSGAINWTPFGTAAGAATEASPGIAKIATQSITDTGTNDTDFITPAKLKNYSGRARGYTQLVGDGSATQFTVTHNLNSQNVMIQVVRVSDQQRVGVEESSPTVNTVVITFASAPTNNQYRVLVLLVPSV